MSTGQTVLLGAIAGFTIFLGLPMGRVRMQSRTTKTFLSGVSAGILVFLFFDILANATEPLDEAVTAHAWGRLTGVGLTFAVGLGIGLLGLLYVSRLWRRRSVPASLGPGAMAVAAAPDRTREALRVGMSIAIGIGLHNATEGFGIVGPLAAADVRATWGWLVVAGIVGGGPTFLGTLVGTSINSTYVFVAF